MELWRIVSGKEKFTAKHWLILASFIVCMFIFTAWSVAYTSQSAFCGSCHEMSAMEKAWRTSSHKNVDCIDCHEQPTLTGVAKAKAKGAKELYLHLTGAQVTPKAEAKDVNCYNCHQDKVKMSAETAAARKDPHTIKHFNNGMTCLSCHSGIVHDASVNNSVPSRETCVSCHWDQMKK